MGAKTRVIDIWPTPSPLPDSLPAVPEFQAALLPDALRPWIMDIAERIQCPPEFPAAGALVALSSVVGRQIAIRPKARDSWTVVPNLWGAVVGRPGVMKSPALSEVMRPLLHLEGLARAEFTKAEGDHKAAALVRDAQAKQAAKEVADAVRAGDLGGANDRAQSAIFDDAEPPSRRRYRTNDCTVEKLGELLEANPRGLLLFRDELVGWLQSLDREGREGARAFFLECWAGDSSFTFDRIGRGTLDIEAACVSILGGIQPGPLAQYLNAAKKGAGDDGLIQRLQVVVWPDLGGDWRNVDRFPDSTARQEAWRVFERLDQINPGARGAESEAGSRPFLRFDAEAVEIFTAWRCDLEARLRNSDDGEAFVSHLAKYRSLAPSLALLFHLVDNDTGPVGRTAIVRALAWVQFLEAHAQRFYHASTAPEVDAARAILRRIKRGDLASEFRARDVYRKGWAGLGDRITVDAALELLADLDWLLMFEPETGGRPTVAYRVNPKADP